ncbi:PH domain-containing protein [Rummeliibacillus suwonensis]|uniref:PH domain-containing protein n=1 Tax=Rummeliibacillus suwonensis TaxID=1306154 RepID=UPI00289C535C|nr:PH domain-containing protein [Rummeliibacillus suwonensis]
MVFKAKKDLLATLIVWGIIIGCSIITVYLNTSKVVDVHDFEKIALTVLFSILSLTFLLFWFTTFYVIKNDTVNIRSGFLKWSIPIKSIISVIESKNPLAGPALAINRLEIIYGNSKTIRISPKSKDKFIELLKEKNKNIQIKIH